MVVDFLIDLHLPRPIYGQADIAIMSSNWKLRYAHDRPDTGSLGMLLLPLVLCAVLLGCSNASAPKSSAKANEGSDESIPAGSLRIRGAGSTFTAPLYKRWFSDYNHTHTGRYVTYDVVGSSEGVRRFLGKAVSDEDLVDFGASDAALSDSEIAAVNNNVLMIPVTAGCVVLAYNLPEFTGELRLSRRVYSGIFQGEITDWSDPLIADDNPGAKLPHRTIVTAVRQDGSGTTFAFTNNLYSISDKWRTQFGPATLINWPGNAMRGKGNEGVAGLIENSTGSIGYVGYEFARRIGLNYASLENKQGNYVKPSEQSCAKALATAELPENLRAFVPDPSGAESYPIVTFSWALIRKTYNNTQTADAVYQLFQWSLLDGQRVAPELGYVALPSNIVKKALVALNNIGPRSQEH